MKEMPTKKSINKFISSRSRLFITGLNNANKAIYTNMITAMARSLNRKLYDND